MVSCEVHYDWSIGWLVEWGALASCLKIMSASCDTFQSWQRSSHVSKFKWWRTVFHARSRRAQRWSGIIKIVTCNFYEQCNRKGEQDRILLWAKQYPGCNQLFPGLAAWRGPDWQPLVSQLSWEHCSSSWEHCASSWEWVSFPWCYYSINDPPKQSHHHPLVLALAAASII